MKFAANLLKYFAGSRPVSRAPAVAPAPLLLALEPRIVYDASVAGVGATHSHAEADTHVTAASAETAVHRAAEAVARSAAADPAPAPAQQAGSTARQTALTATHGFIESIVAAGEKQVVFIDPSVANYQQLIAGLPAGTEYVVLNASGDGLAQIAQYLQQHPSVEAIHLISHGTDGQVQVGGIWLNEGDLSAYSGELAQIGAAMKPGGDFLIYGCDVAAGTDGQMLVQQIASVSHLNVAASTDATGAAALGGNWTLEFDVGTVRTPVIVSAAAEQRYGGLLGVTNETFDSNVGYVTSGGASGVTSFTLDGVTYTTDQAVETAVDSYNVNQFGPPPLTSSSDPNNGVLFMNVQGTSLSSVTINLQNGDAMKVQGFDIDVVAGTEVWIEANGDPANKFVLTTNGDGVETTFHVDLSGNSLFSGITSLKIVDVNDSAGIFLPTIDNFSYVDLSSPPQLTATTGSTAFVAADNAASTPVVIDSGITLTDGDSTTAASGTVSITGHLQSGEDVLAFTNTSSSTYGNISSSYNASTGVLTLTSSGGTATIAQWQAAFDAVTYTNTAVTPNTATRTVSFTLTSDNYTGSNTVQKSVTVADTDQTPVVTATGGTTNVEAGVSAAAIDSGITVSDLDSPSLSSGTVSIGSGFHSGDTLAFTNTDSTTFGNINNGSYNTGTGVLTLSGTATDAQWESALRAVTFTSTSTSTTYGNRTISFAVSDGTKTSAASSHTVDLTSPPQVTTDTGSAAFVAGDNTASTPVAIDSGLTVTDASVSTLSSATVALTGNFHNGEDVLAFTNTSSATYGDISSAYNASTGVLTLTSSSGATLAQWGAALRAVTYTDTALTPNTATRTASFTVTDSNGVTSNTATRAVTVADTDQTPIVTATGGTTSYVGGTSALTVDGGITVSDLDSTTQASGTVSIGSGFHSGDTLVFTNTSGTFFGNITGSYNAATGVLTLTSSGATASDAQWSNALSAVTFSAGSSVTPGNRTISFATSDGTKTSAAATDIVNVVGPPQVATDTGSATFVAGDNTASTPVTIDSGVTVTDASASTLSSATVSITSNFHSGEDVLAFANTSSATYGDIAASYNGSTGVLTLTSAGSSTLAQWNAALQAVTYTDAAVTPNNATRTLSFTVTDTNSNTSNTATRTVTVADTDQTPIVTTVGGTTSYVGGTSALTVDGGITVNDLDSSTQASGTVSIGSGFHSGDTLVFTNTSGTLFGNITGSYNAATGVLTLTSSGATASDAQWSNALSAVTFASTSTTYGSRTISFATNDGTKTSAAATDTVDMTTPVNVTTDTGSAAFVAGDNTASTPVAIDSSVTVTDASASTLSSATVSITGNFHSGEDVLAFTNTSSTTYGDIAASYNATTGVLTLTSAGSSTLAQWNAALQAVTYTDAAVTPNTATRTLGFTVTDANSNASNTATRAVTVTDTDQTPIVIATGGTTSYVGGTSAVTVDSGITLSDLDNTTQASGTVSIGGGFHSGDTLAFTNTSGTLFGNITGSYNAATGVLTLTSSGTTATDAQWENALSAVTFSAGSSVTPGNRTISFATNDGTKTSAAATDTVNVVGPPQVVTDTGSATFVAGDNTVSTPVAIDSGVTVTDASASTLSSATVSITGNFHSGEDVLAFANTSSTTYGDIAASYNASTGVLTLTSAGSSTLAQWNAALQAVTYTDAAVTPNTATRTLSFLVTDTNSNTSNAATRTVTVADTDQTPIVTTVGGTTSYVGGTSAMTIDSGITLSDLDSTTQASGTVSIGSGFHSGDTLAFMNTSGTLFGNISGSYNAATGVLTLTSSGATASDAQWANALSAVTFSAGSSVTPGNRTISFATNDGTKTSAAATDTVNVVGPPQVATDTGSASFVAADNTASTPVAIDSGVTVTDASASTLSSSTVSITGNLHSGEDVLAFTNTSSTTYGDIAASYNATTGVLTLTSAGSSTLAQWNAALQAVTYTDTAVTPNTATRTLSFSVTDTNSNTSNAATRTVTVADTDQTPILTATGGTTSYVGGTSAVTVDGGITVSDLDSTTQASGTVSIGSGFHSGDTLAFTNTSGTMFGNISGSYNAATGVLTLTSSGATATDTQWANALSAVTFSAGSSATPGNRTISFATSDGSKTSAAATDTVNVVGPPQVATDTGSATFVAGDNTASTPVAIDSGVTVTGGSASTLSSATVSITGNYQSGEDVLAFANTSSATYGDIAASYNASTGVLTLNSAGAATLAQWNAALEAVTYTDSAVTPNNATRTLSFTVTDTNNNVSNTATRTVTVTDTDQTPVITTASGTSNYASGASAATIDSGIALSDLDNTTQASGTVTIGSGFQSGDTLAFTNTDATTFGNITGSYNAATGVLTLASAGATATDAQWASALSAVTFASTSTTYGNRTISFRTSDGSKTSAAATDTVNVTNPLNVSPASGTASFVAGDNTPSTPIPVAPGVTVTDANTGASTLSSATVSITGNFHNGEDVLAFANTSSTTYGDISGSYNASTGVLTLTSAGSSTLAQWTAALRGVTYNDTAVTPNNATRTLSFTVTDSGGYINNAATRTVTVADTDQTPIVTTAGGTTSYVGGTSAVTIDSGIALSDLDTTTQSSATVAITGGFHSGDTLGFANTSHITGTYNASTGVLTLTGSASDAEWAAALSSVTFASSSSAAGSRTISFVTNDGTKASAAATDTVSMTVPVRTPPHMPTVAPPATTSANTLVPPPSFEPTTGARDSNSLLFEPPTGDSGSNSLLLELPAGDGDSIQANHDTPDVGSIAAAPTMTFSDPTAPHSRFSLDSTSVSRFQSLVPGGLGGELSSTFDLPPTDATIEAMPNTPFSMNLAKALGIDGSLSVGSDVVVRLADGKPLPLWLHYNAADGTLRGELPPGVHDVRIVVQSRDASGHVTRHNAVLAPSAHRATQAPHRPALAPHAARSSAVQTVGQAGRAIPLPAGKPSLAQQFAQARAALHVQRAPAGTAFITEQAG